MTNREAFRFGFLLRCAEEGLNPDQTQQRVKQAFYGAAKDLGSTLWGGLKTMGGLGIAGGVGVGAAGGYLAAKATEPDADPEEAKLQELVATYRLYADNARRKALHRTYRKPIRAPQLT